MDSRLLWGLAGLLSYMAAAIALAMAVAPMFEAGSLAAFELERRSLFLLIVSAMLFGLGGICLRQATGRATMSSPTAQHSGEGGSGGASGGGGTAAEGRVVCQECGTENEAMFTYCEHCAQKL